MRTIIIPLVGNSTRFFQAGYDIVKYKLLLSREKSVLWFILSYINRDFKVIIVLNKKYNDKKWVLNQLDELGFILFEIIEIGDTDGQLTSVKNGILKSSLTHHDDELIIYNGDTVRHLPFDFNFCDCSGLIEVFNQSGDHWSFVDNLGNVNKVTEKKRISNYCSTGLYGFKSVELFLKYSKDASMINNEKYVAPVFNVLIQNNLVVKSFISNNNSFSLCGTPTDYEKNKFFL